MSNTKEIIAVFIDGENINPLDFVYIQKEIRTHGRVVISNVYGDWSDNNIKKWIDIARENGILKIQCDKINGKNSIDLRMSVDMMKYLYTNNLITIFYLITTDSDYRHVIFEIKQKNKKVYCIGNSQVNVGLTSICDLYTKIENIKKQNQDNQIQDYWNHIENYLNNKGKTNLSIIKEVIQNSFPEFDYREYGYSKFSDFMNKNYKNIKIEKSNIELIYNET